MIDKKLLLLNQIRFFQDYNDDVQLMSCERPILYGAHIKPKENVIREIPAFGTKYFPLLKKDLNRLTFVEDLLNGLIKKVQSELIRKPKKARNRHLHIHSRNCIESNTKYGGDAIHHSHGVWSIHPDIEAGFNQLLVPFNRQLLTKEQGIEYVNKKLYTFCPAILEPFSESIHSVLLEECYNLNLLLDYCIKHSDKSDQYNTWGTFDTPTMKKKNVNE